MLKRGLRDINGKDVLAGLTQISNVCETKVVDGKEVPCAGSLSYRGYDIKELTRDLLKMTDTASKNGTYLLLFGKLPNGEELEDFTLFWRTSAPPSYEFRKGRYHESTVQGHYECPVQKCAYTLLL